MIMSMDFPAVEVNAGKACAIGNLGAETGKLTFVM